MSQLYRSALATAKHTVLMTDNGEDGIAEALREKPDLVILDLNMTCISKTSACTGWCPGTTVAYGANAECSAQRGCPT